MKSLTRITQCAACCLPAFLFISCDNTRDLAERTEEAVSETSESAQGKMTELKSASSEAWRSFANYSVEKKDQALAFLKDQSEEIDEEMEEVRQAASERSGSAQEKAQAAWENLKEKRAELRQQIERTREATAGEWDEVTDETREAWDEFVQYLRAVKAELAQSS